MMRAENVSVEYGDLTVLDDVDFSLEAGQWLMLCGPNGAGKSTLVSAVSQGARYTGTITVGGRDVKTLRPRQLARMVGILSQNNSVGYAFTVDEVVSMGRYAHARNPLSHKDGAGREHVDAAIADAGLEALRHRSMLTLSGGEMQRAFLAQVFAQDPEILILDEPANHLDLLYQKQLFALIGRWLARPGRGVISVVHDLSLAKRYGTHALLLDRGRRLAFGPAGEVLTPKNLERAYGMDVYGWMREMYAQWREE